VKILLADDSAPSRYLLQRAVEELGHEAVVAADGNQAWERFLESVPEVVISDWIMPGMDGDELCRRIRADPDAPYTYFVMLTSLEDNKLYGMQAGVDDYLTKPLDREELGARLIAASRVTALHRRIVEQQQELNHEVEMAASIQRGLLPARPPDVAGIELAGRCAPAAHVGGDYYDLMVDDHGGLFALIADVAGHSIGSALMMAMARTLLRRDAAQGVDPATLLGATNSAMFHDLVTAGLFITMFCARYGPVTEELTYANAGHNLPLLRRADGSIEELDADGAAVGILEDVTFELRTVAVRPGDALLLYTDGGVEAADPAGEPFGDHRLAELMRRDGGRPASKLIESVFAAVRSHIGGLPQKDDVTVVTLRVSDEPA
jgi:serine phosphatase RsbU (regulator of sigma subunit)